MILFSAKAFNILPIVDCAKAALTEITVDPFLRLVDDRKLQAVKIGPNQPTNVYGSNEDDTLALKTLSEIQIVEQRRETLASEIVRNMASLSEPELSTIHSELCKEFVPDDVCPLGAQLPMDAPHKSCQAGAEENQSIKEGALILSIDDDYDDGDDTFSEPFESQIEDSSVFSKEIPNIVDVNQLLESVLETAYQFGRGSDSDSTGPDLSYKEISRCCEELVTGKQKKMARLMSAQPRHESSIGSSFQHPVNMTKQAGPVLERTAGTDALKKPIGALLIPCATEYHNHIPPFLRIPASTPYDNFLKAAGS